MIHTLFIDTSQTGCHVGFAFDGFFKKKLNQMGSSTASILPGMVQDILGTHLNQLERIVVCTGPGSFTGLRVGISFAHGLGFALQVPVFGITIFDALRTIRQDPNLLIALDTKCNDFYGAVYPGGIEKIFTSDEVEFYQHKGYGVVRDAGAETLDGLYVCAQRGLLSPDPAPYYMRAIYVK